MSISQVNSATTMAVAVLRRNAALQSTATPAQPRQADSVTLSDSAKALSSARQAVGNAADVREDRVSAIKAAIANGTYNVDSRTLARAIVKKGLSAS